MSGHSGDPSGHSIGASANQGSLPISTAENAAFCGMKLAPTSWNILVVVQLVVSQSKGTPNID